MADALMAWLETRGASHEPCKTCGAPAKTRVREAYPNSSCIYDLAAYCETDYDDAIAFIRALREARRLRMAGIA